MTKTTTRVLAGVAVAALAAAGVAAVIRYRQGQKPHPDEHAHLDELETRLYEVEDLGENTPPDPRWSGPPKPPAKSGHFGGTVTTMDYRAKARDLEPRAGDCS
jgi:hypothetical protein